MATRVNKGLAPGIPGLSDGPGLSQSPSLTNAFAGLSGNTSGSTNGNGQLVLNSARKTTFPYLIGFY